MASSYSNQFTINTVLTTTAYVSGGTATLVATANLTEWQNGSGTALSYIDPNGYMYAPRINVNNTGISNAPLAIKSNAATNPVSVIQGFTSQTADFMQIQDSTSNVLLRINSSGYIQPTDQSKTVVVKQSAAKTATITGAVGNGTFITYTASNTFVVGETVTITGVISSGNTLGTAGAGFNLTNAVIASATSTQFVITNALADTYSGSGSATTANTSDIYQVQDSTGTAQLKVNSTGSTSTNFNTPGTFTAQSTASFGFVQTNGLVIQTDGNNGIIRPYSGTGTIKITTNGTTATALTVNQQYAGGTADLTQWTNQTNTVLAKVDYAGNITATNLQLDIQPLDDLRYKFDGIESRFPLNWQGVLQAITNPFRLLITLNGIIQNVSLPEYVWGTPFSYDGLILDSDGYMSFSEVPPAGTTFTGMIQAGATTPVTTYSYPFKAMDILLGAY